MKFQLPKLTGWVTSTVYPGLEMECWLNPTVEDYEPPETRQAWDSEYLWQLARLFLRLRVPASLTEDGQEQVIELGSAKALWELGQMPGWDRGELERFLGAWSTQRVQLLEDAEKN